MEKKVKDCKILVLGTGAWGTTLASLLARKGYSTTLWGRRPEFVAELRERRENARYLSGIPLPASLTFAAPFLPCEEVSPSPSPYDLAVCALPTPYLRQTLRAMKTILQTIPRFLSGAKGMEEKTLKLPTEIIQEELSSAVSGKPISTAVLSGPSLALEVAQGKPTSVVIASADPALASFCQDIFFTPAFRIYTNTDAYGVELAAVLKNIIAIAMGVAEGLGLGDNAKAALVSRGLVEMARLGEARGARRSTFFGVAGLGDLITTAYSPLGRNHRVGLLLGQGQTLPHILESMVEVAEGVWSVKAVLDLAQHKNVDMPISQAVYNVLHGGNTPRQALHQLLSRSPKDESLDLP